MPTQPMLPAPGRRQTLKQYCIFERIIIRPTSASMKIYISQTLGLPFYCLKFPQVLKKKKEAGAHS